MNCGHALLQVTVMNLQHELSNSTNNHSQDMLHPGCEPVMSRIQVTSVTTTANLVSCLDKWDQHLVIQIRVEEK